MFYGPRMKVCMCVVGEQSLYCIPDRQVNPPQFQAPQGISRHLSIKNTLKPGNAKLAPNAPILGIISNRHCTIFCD